MGTVILSLDAELAWGFHDLEKLPAARINGARMAWIELIDMFDKFEIPTTWAVVGHLFLNECDGIHDGLESKVGWFQRDPGGHTDESNNWLAPDLIEAIRNARVNHEIGSHTFSHVDFGDQSMSRDVAVAELRESRRLASEWGIDLDSFVFPRNNIGYRELLAEFDFKCYRGNKPERWYDGTSMRPIGKTISMAVGSSPPPTVRPEVDEYGLVNIPASLDLFTFEGLPKQIITQVVEDPVVRKAKLGIEAVADSDDVFHMWLHPNNLTSKEDLKRIELILKFLDSVRERRDLVVRTMGEVAAKQSLTNVR